MSNVPILPSNTREGVILMAFTCGWMQLPMSFFLEGEPGQVTAPATAYLIDHPTGGLALFDTGLGPRFQRPAGAEPSGPVDLASDANIGARLEAIGIDPASIRWVINSHFHTDHAGGNLYFPNATVVVQDQEWVFAFSENNDIAYHRAEYDLGHKMLRVHGEHDLFGDGSVVLFPTTGHTPGHQSARVKLPGGDVVLAADCCNLRRSLDEMRIPDHCFNAEDYINTLRRLAAMRESGARIFYGHDPEFWDDLPKAKPLT